MTNIQSYVKKNGLDRLLRDHHSIPKQFSDVYANVNADHLSNFPPEIEDLVRLHYLIRKNFSMTVLEFGVGFSTLVIADALQKNEADFATLPAAQQKRIRNKNLFRVFSVDASRKWIRKTASMLPSHLKDRVHLLHSGISMTAVDHEVCSMYSRLPNIVPDFIYLDGPNPKDIKGNIHGLDFQCDERTVISADILLYESTLIPGCRILIDGRTNNHRFLDRRLKRSWTSRKYPRHDVSLLSLDEAPLGAINAAELSIKKKFGQRIADPGLMR